MAAGAATPLKDPIPSFPVLKNTLVYVNPAAGSGRAEPVWRRLLRHRPALSEAQVVLAGERDEGRGDLRRRLQEEGPEERVERIISVGGDGTFNVVANEVLELERGGDLELGLVPAGTGSDLARTLGLPRQPEVALDRALASASRPLDALLVESLPESPGAATRRSYSFNVASAGISGLVDEAVNRQARRSSVVYVRETLKAAVEYRPVPCSVRLDGEPWYEGEVFLLAVANARSFGRGMKIAPHAEVDDGLMDVVLVGPFPRWQLPLRMPLLFLGRHLAMKPVQSRRASRIELVPHAPLPALDLDGESFEAGAVTMEVRPGALRVLA